MKAHTPHFFSSFSLFIFCALCAFSSFGFDIDLDLAWDNPAESGVQPGSIFQVFLYQTTSNPGGNPAQNFQMGENGYYNPNTVDRAIPVGNGTLDSACSFSGQFNVMDALLRNFPNLTVRVFSSTNFDESWETEWGRSSFVSLSGATSPYSVTVRNVELGNTLQFADEPPPAPQSPLAPFVDSVTGVPSASTSAAVSVAVALVVLVVISLAIRYFVKAAKL